MRADFGGVPRLTLVCALSCGLFFAFTAQAAPPVDPLKPPSDFVALPLTGAAYQVAAKGYAAFNAHDYAAAVAFAREAVRQRPDLAQLRLLLANAQAAQGNLTAARQTLDEAIRDIGDETNLTTRREQFIAQLAAHSRQAVTLNARQKREIRAQKIAQAAYDAYGQKHFQLALNQARQAIDLRPDLLRLRLLAIDAAIGLGRYEEAWQFIEEARQGFGASSELQTVMRPVGEHLAVAPGRQAFLASEKNDAAQAAALASKAVAYDLRRPGYRLLLLRALLAEKRYAAAETAATAALDAGLDAPLFLTLRGYARLARGNADSAAEDFSAASQKEQSAPPQTETRALPLIIADAWLAAGQPQKSLAALDTCLNRQAAKPDNDDMSAQLAGRRQAARQLAENGRVAPTAMASAQPVFDCLSDEYGVSCAVLPADPAFAERKAAILADQCGDREEAARLRRQIASQTPPTSPDAARNRLALINALDAAGQREQADIEAKALVDAGLLPALPPLSAAYVAQRTGRPKQALAFFQTADTLGQLPPSAAADAAYSAYHARQDAAATRYIERAIDHGQAAGEHPATPAHMADWRGLHADLTRSYGLIASVNYRGAATHPGLEGGGAPSDSQSETWQSGLEGYWRPFGSLGDRNLEVYARAYLDLDSDSGATGFDTTTGALGIRAKPFAAANLVLAFERVFNIGSEGGLAEDDWLARLAYSNGYGAELRWDTPSWWTLNGYGEVGRYLEQNRNYGTGYAQAGRSWRLDAISPKLTAFPHAVLGVEYDDGIDHQLPLGLGGGLSARWWFRDGDYDAPRSYLDISLEYRRQITSTDDDRQDGFFFGAILSY
ncbi:MAG: tetratricopeptide repeat protein [Desulfobulbaceae bacterium]|jgi:hypothetical protein|nr:tetratricopeptide repeat protein [Desulfobulbaceae bacterium]